MTTLPIPAICCECGFTTIDAKEAYEHAMKHEADRVEEELRRLVEYQFRNKPF